MAPVISTLTTFRDLEVPTRVRLDVEYQEGVPERFVDDDADIMLIIDADERTGGHEVTLVEPLEMVLVVSSGHPLAAVQELHRQDLVAYMDLVVRDSSLRFRRQPRETYLGNPHIIYLSDFHSKRIALLAGVGFGWMPLHLVDEALADERLVLVNLIEGNRWTYRPRLVVCRRAGPSRAAELFAKTFLESA